MKIGNYEVNHIYEGDAKELSAGIPDDSIHLTLCDPVYWDIDFYEFVAQESARILIPGGSCIVQLGQYFLPQVMSVMSKHLEYYWIDSQRLGVNSRMWDKKLFVKWKPFLWFWKPSSEGRRGGWTIDSMYAPRDKEHHIWGDGVQSYISVISGCTIQNDIVVDFCTGGGTVPAACKTLGRNFIVFEIEPDHIVDARRRIFETPFPLPIDIPQPIQGGLFCDAAEPPFTADESGFEELA